MTRPSLLVLLSSIVVAACGAPATVATTTSPAPAMQPSSTAPLPAVAPLVTSVPRTTLAEAPRNWQLLDEATDHVPGISAERAMTELLAGKAPRRTVLVAIIDNGIDTAHIDLRANLWVNPREVGGNGKDDDKNGYIDDVHGWNFIGGKDGQDVHWDTFEVTREYARCHNQPAASGLAPITDPARRREIDAAYEKQKATVEGSVGNLREAQDVLDKIIPMLRSALGGGEVTAERVKTVQPRDPQTAQAKAIFLSLDSQGGTPAAIADGLKSLEGQVKYGLNLSYNTRTIVGDHYADPTERAYGNADVMGQDAKHGTHVAGIIGAVRDNGIGIDGIAPAVKFMMLRVVPDGDERDKDVANAIRYATDNGAQIISMSFGKAYSPMKAAVDDAVKYADSHGILMVHAAGNDGENLADGKNFPTPLYTGGGRPANWIEVGASSWKGGDSLAAPFSNYGANEVDVFAPGVDILSTIPGNQYERDSGTSMAAPVVSGLAALIMDYYPNLTAADVRRVITGSVTKLNGQQVVKPGAKGSDPKVPFGSLSVTGGIVNAYSAIKMAEEMSNGKARP